jgi:hypothetical protein
MQTATLALGAQPAPDAWAALDEASEWQGFSRPLPGHPETWESYLAIG